MEVVAVPKYNFDGCQDEYYSSVLISHNNITIDDVRGKVVAINSMSSMSGNVLLYSALGSSIADTTTKIYTGSHLNSIKECLLNPL